MTKTQIWTAVFLLLFVILFFLQRMTKKEEMHHPLPANHPAEVQPEQSQSIPEGALLMRNFGCNTCHGNDYNGTATAPALVNLSQYYDRDKLINYLRNPNSFMDSDRFKAFKEKYRSVMPPYNNKDVKDLGKIADYLLSK